MLRSLSPNLTVTELATDKASLAIVYGRRRIGKSTLIREAIKNRTHIFYQATRVTSSLNLESFKAEVAHGRGVDDLLTGLGDWLAVLHYLARAAEQKPGLTIVLDEFPYLVDADCALPTIVQKFWDSGAARAGNLKLLLCGSMIAQMEALLAERNPLYGRKTLVLDLGPLSFREAAHFVRYSAEKKLLTCGVFGGTPFYLEQLRDSESLKATSSGSY
jgi:AAA+ ATPase superfamily predicted ATPase